MHAKRFAARVLVLVFLASTAAAPRAPAAANMWDSVSSIGWGTASCWTNDTTPTFNNTLDVYFYASGATVLNNNIGSDRTIRSLNYNANATTTFTIAINRPITGSFGIIKNGTGQTALTSSNTFTGGITINAGALALDGSADNNTPSVTLAGGSLRVGSAFVGGTCNIGNLSGTAGDVSPVWGSTVGTRTLSIDQSVNGTYAGTIIDGSGSRVLAVTKTGAATLTLSGANTYSGATTIQAGTLALSGAGTLGGSEVAVAAGATLDVAGATGGSYTLAPGQILKGNGAVTGGLIMAAGSTLSPGFSTGTNVFSGPLTLSGNTNAFELASATDYDQVIVTGGLLTLQSGPVLSLLVGGLSAANGTEFVLFSNRSGSAPVLTSNFRLEGGGELADEAPFTVDGREFRIDYQGGDGDDITLTVIPEPAAVGLLGVAGLALLWRRRLQTP